MKNGLRLKIIQGFIRRYSYRGNLWMPSIIKASLKLILKDICHNLNIA